MNQELHLVPTKKHTIGGIISAAHDMTFFNSLMYNKGDLSIVEPSSFLSENPDDVTSWIPQHLYLISDAEIKEGNWFIDTSVLDSNGNATITKAIWSTDLTFLNHHTKKPYIKKIEATTNEELRGRGARILDTNFIKAYVKGNTKHLVYVETDLAKTFYIDICRAYNAGKQNQVDILTGDSSFVSSHDYFTKEFPAFKTNVP